MKNSDLLRYVNISALRRKVLSNRIGDIYPDDSLDMLDIDTLAYNICNHIGITVPVKLSIDPIDAPGRMTNLNNGKYQIQINPNLVGRTNAEIYVLAHEYTHVFLIENKISEKDELANESMTDLQCIYLGFGMQMRKSIHFDSVSNDIISHKKYGYLTDLEICEEIARYAILNCSVSRFDNDKEVCMTIKKLQKAMTASLFWRIKKWVAIYLLSQMSIQVEYQCPICEKKCRVPLMIKVIKINCPICKCSFKR